MALKRHLLATLWIMTVLSAQDAMAYEAVDDLVELFSTDDSFIAVVDGRRSFEADRRSGEKIAWQGARGEVGAFLTNERLLAVSVRSGQWNTRYLKINEKKEVPRMLLAAHLVVMLSHERILVFGTLTDGFFQERLPIGQPILAGEAEGRVAAVITPDRAFGLSTFRRGAAEIRFRIQERFESIRTSYNTITLRTSQRLIAFAAGDAVWRDIALD